MTKLGLHTDLAAHALGCPAYERQTDAGALVAPVELLEHAEDAVLMFWRDADTVIFEPETDDTSGVGLTDCWIGEFLD